MNNTPNLKKLFNSPYSPPVFFLAVLLLTFGFYVNQLGYFWDDWQVLFLKRTYGLEGVNYLLSIGGRPFYIWIYSLTMGLLGDKPVNWHLFALFARWLAVLSMWWALKQLWPKQARMVTWAATLFAIYPIFKLQPMAIIMSQDFVLYAIFFVSFGSMLAAHRQPQHFRGFIALSLATAALHIFTKEYYLGLELLRPLALWLIFSEKQKDWRNSLKAALKAWVPYLAIVVAFMVWRLFILEAPREQNPLMLLDNLQSNFWPALLEPVQVWLRNFIFVIFEIWSQGASPAALDLSSPFSLLSWALIILGAAFAYFYVIRLQDSQASNAEKSWNDQALAFGAAAMLFGLIPTLVIGKDPLSGLFSDRFNLPTMFGAAVFIVALVSWLVSERQKHTLVLAALIGLAMAILVRQTNEFRWSWDEQKNFYWQLSWRAPDIAPGTAIIGDGALTAFVDGYAAAAAINLLYPQPSGAIPHELGYWYLDIHSFADREMDFLEGIPLFAESTSDTFTGTSLKSIFVYDGEPGQCLWVLSTHDASNHQLPLIYQKLLPSVDLSLIRSQPRNPDYPPLDVFGPEPEHSWCYYFQKAELALQNRNWREVLSLWDTSVQLGLRPNVSFELLPFIEAYTKLGDWEEAFELSREMYRRNLATKTLLCASWQRFISETEPTETRQTVVLELQEHINCEQSLISE